MYSNFDDNNMYAILSLDYLNFRVANTIELK